ncbi:hypothetical protein D3C81_1172450 [compost metagenome]
MRHLRAEIPAVDLFEVPLAAFVLAVGDALDALFGIGDHHAVLVVQVEVGAGGVGHDLVRVEGDQRVEGRGAWRQRVARQQFEAARGEQLQFELHQVGAQHHQPAAAIDGVDRAHAAGLAAAVAAAGLHVVPERAGTGMSIGAVAVAMHVAIAVAGQMRVLRQAAGQGMRLGRTAQQCSGVAGAVEGRRQTGFGAGGEQAHGEQEGKAHRLPRRVVFRVLL